MVQGGHLPQYQTWKVFTDEDLSWRRVNEYADPHNATCYLLRWRGRCEGVGLSATTVLPYFGSWGGFVKCAQSRAYVSGLLGRFSIASRAGDELR